MTEQEKEIYWRGYNDALCSKMDGLRNALTKQQRIEKVVCDYFGVSMEDIRKRIRKECIRYPRQILTYFLSKKTTMGCVKIARVINQDHSTVLYSLSLIKNLLTNNEEVQADVMELETRLNKALEVVQIAPNLNLKKEPRVIGENEIVFFHRPKAEYSNTGYINLSRKLNQEAV
jgi:hypothetical protein